METSACLTIIVVYSNKQPPGEKQQAANWRDRSEPTHIGYRQKIQGSGKDHDSGRPDPNDGWISAGGPERRHSVHEMVENSGLPNSVGLVGCKKRSELMSAEGSQGHAQKPENACDLNGKLHRNRMFVAFPRLFNRDCAVRCLRRS